MIKGLAHIAFTVRDLDACIAFYEKDLGFRVAFDYRDEEGKRKAAYLHIGERTFIELFRGEPDAPTMDPPYRHFSLEVDDLKATIAALRANGVELVKPFKRGQDRSWQAWIEDPAGNLIELQEYTAESKQQAAL
jgi:catechol 2,3-dioxygenase-like lactoylglutathione lyase family enzyme